MTTPLSALETLLFVDDDNALRKLVERMLTRRGYVVIGAGEGLAAMHLLEQHADISLVITDMSMPGMSGYSLAQRIIARHPAMRILFISGYTLNPQACRDLAGTAVAFLHKPFVPDMLVDAIRELLDRPPSRSGDPSIPLPPIASSGELK